MTTASVARLVVVLAVPAPDPSPFPRVSRDRLEAALLADSVDAAESLAAARIAVLCAPHQVDAVSAAAIDTTVWTSQRPTVGEAATRASAAGADQLAVLASDAPHLPGLLIGKLFRPLARSEVTVCSDPRGMATALGLRLPLASWAGEVDLDRRDVVDRLLSRAPRRTSVRTAPGWRRLREPADFAALDSGVEGADLTRALHRSV